MATIVRASASDIDDVAVLFAVYRRFYDQPTDLAKAKAIIGDRIRNDESVIFLACTENDDAIGFTQLYTTFCSVAAGPVWVLHDLSVAQQARRWNVAAELMARATDHAR